MSERSLSLIQRVRNVLDRGLWEVVAILVLIALVSLAALALLQSQVSEVLSTVSHSV
ncbi:MAG: hypothetical protein ABIZ52_03475 [Candidatus Limnocylindrales bacterium]